MALLNAFSRMAENVLISLLFIFISRIPGLVIVRRLQLNTIWFFESQLHLTSIWYWSICCNINSTMCEDDKEMPNSSILYLLILVVKITTLQDKPHTFLVNFQVVERCSIDFCRWQATAGEVHVVWRSKDEHPATEGQQNTISLTLFTIIPLPALHSAINLNICSLCGGKNRRWKTVIQSIFLNGDIKPNDLRNGGINLLVGMCRTSTTVGVASVPSNKNTSL